MSKKRKRIEEVESNESQAFASEAEEEVTAHQRPERTKQLPSRFRTDSDDTDCDDDQVNCAICGHKDPGTVRGEIIFWIDCDHCGVWVHAKCAFGRNDSSSQYVCQNYVQDKADDCVSE